MDITAALQQVARILDVEEVRYALGLHADHLDNYFRVLPDGTQRAYTEDDLNEDIKNHNLLIKLLNDLAAGSIETLDGMTTIVASTHTED